MKILLLEDEQMLSDAINEYLISLGHRVTSFHNGSEALEILKKEPFDLLILDINVPGINGLELLESLHGLNPYPAIYISALVDIEGNPAVRMIWDVTIISKNRFISKSSPCVSIK